MRVTKAIREYVEEEITNKYAERRNTIGEAYREEQKQVEEHLKVFLEEANEKAKEYIATTGFECYSYGRYYADPFSFNGSIRKPDMERIHDEERRLIDMKCAAKIKQVLFDLEMGETAKNELKQVLDSIVVD